MEKRIIFYFPELGLLSFKRSLKYFLNLFLKNSQLYSELINFKDFIKRQYSIGHTAPVDMEEIAEDAVA